MVPWLASAPAAPAAAAPRAGTPAQDSACAANSPRKVDALFAVAVAISSASAMIRRLYSRASIAPSPASNRARPR
jgi:hypothetical protein